MCALRLVLVMNCWITDVCILLPVHVENLERPAVAFLHLFFSAHPEIDVLRENETADKLVNLLKGDAAHATLHEQAEIVLHTAACQAACDLRVLKCAMSIGISVNAQAPNKVCACTTGLVSSVLRCQPQGMYVFLAARVPWLGWLDNAAPRCTNVGCGNRGHAARYAASLRRRLCSQCCVNHDW